jgi:major vault protein
VCPHVSLSLITDDENPFYDAIKLLANRMSKAFDLNASVVRIPPYEYVHVLDNNTNTTKVLCGPMTFTRQEHQRFIAAPQTMIQIPPRHFARIENPVQRDSKGDPVVDSYGQFKLKFGETEIRMPSQYPDPFPLYPGEVMSGKICLMQIVEVNSALRLKALRDFVNEDDVEIHAGGRFLNFPLYYIHSLLV